MSETEVIIGNVIYAIPKGAPAAYVKDAKGDCITVLPEITYNGVKYVVSEIGEKAFLMAKPSKIVLPPSIRRIRKDAMRFSTGLKMITLPGKLHYLDVGALEECDNLPSINIPGSVKEIGDHCFCQDYRMRSVIFDDPSSGNLKRIGISAFCCCSALTSVEIPDSVEEIGDYAFRYCKSLRHVVLSEKARIGKEVFDEDVEVEYLSTVRDLTGRSLRAFTLGSTE